MSWFSGRKESPHRKVLREQFESLTTSLRYMDELHQVAVGHGINTANSFSLKQFTSVEIFLGLPKTDKLQYIGALTSMEQELGKRDPHSAAGFALFKM